MERAQLQAELIDFMEGRGRFAARKEYVGMDASNVQDLFVGYYEGLNDIHQRTMIHLLADAAVGQSVTLAPYMLPGLSLLLRLCLLQYQSHLRSVQAQLEQVLNAPELIAQWLDAADHELLPDDRSFQQDWHYALMLWGVLYLIGAESTTAVYHRLVTKAKSPRFRQALVTAKTGYDQLSEME